VALAYVYMLIVVIVALLLDPGALS